MIGTFGDIWVQMGAEMRLIDADELMWHKSSLVEPRDKTVSMGKPISDDEIYAYRLGWNEAIDAVMDCAPTVDPVKHGRWEKVTGYYRCSECNQAFPDIGYGFNFCPECGADMREALE